MHSRLPVAANPRGRRLALALLALLFAGPLLASPQDDNRAMAPIIAQIDAGHFHEAQAAIDRALAQPQLSGDTGRALTFQRERMRRILLDFTLDADDVEARVRKQIPDLRDHEFAQWDADGLFERMDIDGKRLYFNRAPGNLFRLSAQARARRAEQTPFTESPLESANPHHREVVAQSRAQHKIGRAHV